MTLAQGSAAWKDHQKLALTIIAPETRVRTTVVFHCQVVSDESGKVLTNAEHLIHLFPASLLEGAKSRLDKRELTVLDKQGELSGLLKAAGIAFESINDIEMMTKVQCDLLIVDSNVLTTNGPDQAAIAGLATHGTRVLIFAQPQLTHLIHQPVVDQVISGNLAWRYDHSLWNRFESADLVSLLTSDHHRLIMIDPLLLSPTTELLYWPINGSDQTDKRRFCLVVTHPLGNGESFSVNCLSPGLHVTRVRSCFSQTL
ncbi:MAG: hypothetical protein HC898_12735 [Phycisphaerales bacterium]|nr:hypothetical protein [Phycisphaerales bacterium]